ncbi:MAG: THxN family PEP-CTERM protein [Rhodoferax sp.]
MKKSLRVLLGACALVGFSAASHATIVTDWSATITGAWTGSTFSSDANEHTSSTVLSWGHSTGDGQSSLTISNPPANENVTTYIGGGTPPSGDIAASNSITHDNNPVTGGSLTGATFTDTIILKALNPLGAGPALSPFSFNIAFLETPNVAGQCPAASPPNNPCNDIFVLLGGFPNFDFDYLGQTYFVNVFPTSGGVLSVLSNSACAAVNAVNSGAPATGCFGFTTQEGAATTLAFGFTVSTLPLSNNVPEPGTIALFGLALLGLAVTRRRTWMR